MKSVITILVFGFVIHSINAQEIKLNHSNSDYFVDTKSFELKNEVSNGYYIVNLDSLKTKIDYEGEISNSKRINKWTWYFDTGLKKREITYANGLFNGEVISYYPNGQKSASMIYSMGIQNGSITRWHPNGNVRLKGNYTNGNPTGLWKYYDEKGQIMKEEQH